MLAALPFLLLLGLFLPGYFLGKWLRQPMLAPAGFLLSLFLLFHAVFWTGIFHVPLTAWSVLPLPVTMGAAAYWASRKLPADPATARQLFKSNERWVGAGIALVGVAFFARSATSPLLGFDMRFRWDFLAQRVLALRSFDFYPPLTPADFHQYFYMDGIPPLISFINWFIYASAGEYLPVLISLFVAAQFVCTLAFTYGAASALYSPRAGVLAAALLAGCPLYFRAAVLGQETGMTALCFAAMFYFLVAPADARGLVLAGVAAALCALSREYGWIALLAGAVVLLWKRQPLRDTVIFCGVAMGGAAPWYVRNLLRCGNPFYSLHFLGFSVNPVHAAIMQYYQSLMGLQKWTAATWTNVIWLLLGAATLPLVAGLPGLFRRVREQGYLAIAAALVAAVWLLSVGYTSAGIEVSTRVLSPCMVVLSLAGAGFLDEFAGTAGRRAAVVAAAAVALAVNAVQGAVYPASPVDLPAGQWAANAFRRPSEPTEFQIAGDLARLLPPGSRILSDNAYLHAALLDKQIDVVPVWSPEVRFLFSASPDEADRRLRALHITTLSYYPTSLNTAYLASASPFYAAVPRLWGVRAQIPRVLYLLAPK